MEADIEDLLKSLLIVLQEHIIKDDHAPDRSFIGLQERARG